VSVVIRLRTGRPKNHASVPGRDDIYFPQNVKTVCKAHPVSYLVGTVDPIPGGVKPFTYRGADKSLARPRRKQATATEDFDVHIILFIIIIGGILVLFIYEGESIIIRNVCFIFIKTTVEILQLHNFST
jgi:hypothetical protein